MSPRTIDDPEFARFAKRALFIAALIGVSLLLWQLKSVLLLAFASALLAILLRTLAVPLAHQTPLRTSAALAIVTIAVLGLFGGTIWALGGQIGSQLAELTERLPNLVNAARTFVEETAFGRALARSMQVPDNIFSSLGAQALSAANVTLGALTELVVIFFLGLFFAFNPRLYVEGAVQFVPQRQRDRALDVFWSTGDALRKWLLAQFAAMVAVGIMTWIALSLLGVPLSLALAFVAFLLEFVPIIGPIVAAIPAILVGLSVEPIYGLYVALAYLAIQQVESYVLVPFLQRWAVKVPPALTLIAVVIFGILFGWPGVVLATPLMVATIVWVKKIYLESVLHNPDTSTGSEPAAVKPQ